MGNIKLEFFLCCKVDSNFLYSVL